MNLFNYFVVYFVDTSNSFDSRHTKLLNKSSEATLADAQNQIDKLAIGVIVEENGTKHAADAYKVLKDDRSRSDGHFLKRSDPKEFPNRVELWKIETVYNSGYFMTRKEVSVQQLGYYDVLLPSNPDVVPGAPPLPELSSSPKKENKASKRAPELHSVVNEFNQLIQDGEFKTFLKSNLKPREDRDFKPEVEMRPTHGKSLKDTALFKELVEKIERKEKEKAIAEDSEEFIMVDVTKSKQD